MACKSYGKWGADSCWIVGQKDQSTNTVVLQIDKKIGEILNEYFSIHEAQRQTKIWTSSISMCCSGKLKTSGGFKWEYKTKKI